MNPELLSSYNGTVRKYDSSNSSSDSFSFKAKITVLDKSVGKGIPVFFYEKVTGALVAKTETNADSYVVVHGLLKSTEYLVVSVDKNSIYNSVVFDITLTNNVELISDLTLSLPQKFLPEETVEFIKDFSKSFQESFEEDIVIAFDNPWEELDSNGGQLLKGSFLKMQDLNNRPCLKVAPDSLGAVYTKRFPVNASKPFTFEVLFTLLADSSSGYIFDNNVFKVLLEPTSRRLTLSCNLSKTTSVSPLNLEETYNIAVCYDGRILSLFLNGVRECEVVTTIVEPSNSVASLLLKNVSSYLYRYRVYPHCKFNENYTPNNLFTKVLKPLKDLDKVFEYKSTGTTANSLVNTHLFTETEFSKSVELTSLFKHTSLVLQDNFLISLNFRAPKANYNTILLSNNVLSKQTSFNNWSLSLNNLKLVLKVPQGDSFTLSPTIIYSELFSLVILKKANKIFIYTNNVQTDELKFLYSFDTSKASDLFVNIQESSIRHLEILRGNTATAVQPEEAVTALAAITDSYSDNDFCIIPNFFEVNLANTTALNFRNILGSNLSVVTDYSYFKRTSLRLSNASLKSLNPVFHFSSDEFTFSFIFSLKTLTQVSQTLFSLYNPDLSKVFKIGVNNGKLQVFNGASWADLDVNINLLEFYSLVFQYREGVFEFYINGSRLPVVLSSISVKDILCHLSIGSFNNTEYFDGYLNLFEVYKRRAIYSQDFSFPPFLDTSYKDSKITMTTVENPPLVNSDDLLFIMEVS